MSTHTRVTLLGVVPFFIFIVGHLSGGSLSRKQFDSQMFTYIFFFQNVLFLGYDDYILMMRQLGRGDTRLLVCWPSHFP